MLPVYASGIVYSAALANFEDAERSTGRLALVTGTVMDVRIKGGTCFYFRGTKGIVRHSDNVL